MYKKICVLFLLLLVFSLFICSVLGQSENQVPVADSGGPYSGIEGLTVSFDGSGSYDPDGNVTSYYWTFGDGEMGSGETVTHIYSQDGNYDVSLTVYDDNLEASTDQILVSIEDTDPVASFSAFPTSGNAPLTVAFSDESSSYDGLVSWEWKLDNGKTSNDPNPVFTYDRKGKYTIELKIIESDGDEDTYSIKDYIEVLVPNQVPVADSGGPYSGIEGLTVSFDGSGSYDPDGNVTSYYWTFGDGEMGSGETVTHIYSQDGNYDVSLTVYDDNLEASTDQILVSIEDTDPVASFSAFPTSGNAPLTVAFSDESSSYDGLVSWLWDFGDGSTSEEQNPNHVYTEGVYTINLTIEEKDGDFNNYSIFDFINVGPQPNISPLADFIIESGVNPVIHQSILFTDTSSDSDGTITSWNWNFGDQKTSTARNPIHQYQNPGVYTITLTVTDDDGASQNTAQQISISENIAPITSHDYDGFWHNKDFFISLSSQDYQSGVKETYYRVNGGQTKSLMNDGQPQINEESSNNVLEFWSVDNLGNEELHNILTNIKLDKTPPVADAGQDVTVNEDTLLTFNGGNSDDNLGIIEYTWIINDGTLQELNTIAPEYVFHTPGVYTVELIVVDAANNLALDTVEIKVIDVTDPIANAGNDLIITQGETVTFDGSKSTDNIKIADFVWSFIDQTPQKIEGVNATHTFWFVGVYEINLTVYDEQGNLGTDLILVTVIDNTWPIADAGFDQIVEEDALVYFDGSNSFDNLGIEIYLWTFTDGELQSLNGVNANYSFGIPGIYEVTLTVSDLEEHSANDTVMIVVRDITSPKIEFTEFSEIIEGIPSTFDASKSYDISGIDSFYWIFGDGTMENSSSPSVTHTYAESGTYALELFVTDKSGNVNSDVISVYVNPDPNADFSSYQSDEKDEGEKLVDNNKLNSDLDNLDITNANINPEGEDLTEPEENQSKINPEDNNSVDFSLGTILTIVIILLLTSYVLYVKWQMRIDKLNEHQNTL